MAPRVSAVDLETGADVALFDRSRLSVVLFGSHTCGPFVGWSGRLQECYEKYGDRVNFHLVYQREAHATDSRFPAKHIDIPEPTDLDERKWVASECVEALRLTLPVLVDDMQDTVSKAFDAYPSRMYVIGIDGRIAFAGPPGPAGFDIDVLEVTLDQLLGVAADRGEPVRPMK